MSTDSNSGELTVRVSPEDFGLLREIASRAALDGLDHAEELRRVLKIREPFIGTIRVVVDYSLAEGER